MFICSVKQAGLANTIASTLYIAISTPMALQNHGRLHLFKLFNYLYM
jgi:hypothetical protein